MGIADLQSLIEADPVLSKVGVKTVDLVKTAWTAGGTGLGAPNRLALVLDGEGCLDRLYGGYYSDWACGGQWNHMLEFMSVLFQTLGQANIHTATFLSGALEPTRFDDWVATQLKVKQNVRNVLRHLNKRGTPPPKVWWVPPTSIRTVMRLALRHLGLPVMLSVEQHTSEVAAFLRENGYHGILGDNSEYCIFDPPRYFSAHKMKLTLKFTLETQEILMDEVAKSFDLNPNRFSLMAALLGNHRLTEWDLKEFHARLLPEMETGKVSAADLIMAVVNFIRTLVKIDDIEALGVDIFGAADPRVEKLKEVVEYYNAGTEEGYKTARPTKKKKDFIKISSLASDSDQQETDGKQAQARVAAGKEAVIVRETEVATEKLANLALGGADRGGEEEEAASEDEVSPAPSPVQLPASEDGRYPRQQPAPAPAPVIPAVNSEVLRTSAERHRQACMAPQLHSLLTTGEILLPVLLEDEGGDIGGIHSVYKELRRRVYGVLFNAHHTNYTSAKYEDELAVAKRKVEAVARNLSKVTEDAIVMKNNEPRSEREVMTEKLEAATAVVEQLKRSKPDFVKDTVVVREWSPYNRYQAAQAESPASLAWPVPTVQRLWFGTGLEDKQKRLRAFLSIMSSDSPLMLQTSHVPQHLLLAGSVLRYIMATQSNLLRKPELDAFLVTALSPELGDAAHLARLKLDLITPRGVQLAALFMHGVEMAILANDACGAPVPFLMCCPWLFFDGKLFHSKLRRAVSAKNLLEMCEHRMEVVIKVERMRKAILEGIVPEALPPMSNFMGNSPNFGINMGMGGIGGMGNMGGFGGLGRMGPMEVGGWGPNFNGRRFHDRHNYPGGRGDLSRGGQLVVAGSVVGQWGGQQSRLGHQGQGQPRARGTRAGKKIKEKKEESAEGENDIRVKVKEVLVKEKPTSVSEE